MPFINNKMSNKTHNKMSFMNNKIHQLVPSNVRLLYPLRFSDVKTRYIITTLVENELVRNYMSLVIFLPSLFHQNLAHFCVVVPFQCKFIICKTPYHSRQRKNVKSTLPMYGLKLLL